MLAINACCKLVQITNCCVGVQDYSTVENSVLNNSCGQVQ